RGRLVWTSGANAGAAAEVRAQDGAAVELAETPAMAIAPGDGFTVTAGCDKTFATCRKRFGNQVNFRGFPLMPGNDWLAQPARSDGDNDGGRRG
ncbi:phage BR0599 family protein, partial [Methylopila musalis]